MSPDLAVRHARSWRELDLAAPGRCLIEASAGTGKTWTITVLYLRLLLEQTLPPSAIAVATFTEAAAEELRERIRARLLWALGRTDPADVADETGMSSPAAADDAGWLAGRWSSDDQRWRDRIRLQLALADLDLAPIGTLHRLCGRILRDHPIECGVAFGLGESGALDDLDETLIDDLWRGLAQSPGELEAGERVWYEAGRATFGHALRRVARADVEVYPVAGMRLAEAIAPENAQTIRARIDAVTFARANSALRTSLLKLAEHIDAGDTTVAFGGKEIEKTLASLREPDEKQFKNADGSGYFADGFPAWVADLAAVLARPEAEAKAAALSRFRAALRTRRDRIAAEQGRIGFDGLIERVADALHGERGRSLADRLFEQWPVILVDEFQDTDGLQYGILDAIHRDDDGQARGLLAMIGDPKQAIYGFRGGDIEVYRRARTSADRHLRLGVNFRSSTALIGALNALFEAGGRTLSRYRDDIAYLPVQPGPDADRDPLSIEGQPCRRPLVCHYRSDPEPNQPDRRRRALADCAEAIADLLAGDVRIGSRRVGPGDVAVLLPRNDDIAALHEELRQRGVHCVGVGRRSVFEVSLARDLHVLLSGIHHLEDEGRVRAALTTDLYGLDFAAMVELDAQPEGWREHAGRLHVWRQRWREAGVLAVVLAVAGHAAEAGRGFGEDRRERGLTDLRHLGELLQAQSARVSGPEELLAWFDRQRGGPDDDAAAEEARLRLESDADRVRLLTLHMSKGLEFPVVFLPLMWMHRGRRDDLPLIHADGRRWLDVGGPDWLRTRALAAQADQDERFRVLYVALTRARHACHLFCLPPERSQDGAKKSPARDPERSPLDAILAHAFQTLGQPSLAGLDGIDWRVHGERPVDSARPLPVEPWIDCRPPPPLPSPRPISHRYSFSALWRRAETVAVTDEARAADDEAGGDLDPGLAGTDPAAPTSLGEPGSVAHPALLALAGVRGIGFGNAVHAILERRRPDRPLREQIELIERSLDEFDVCEPNPPAESLAERVAERLDHTLAVELRPGLRLDRLSATDQRVEMAFHFPLVGVDVDRLRRACREHGEPDPLSGSGRYTLDGLMSGKIDLCFRHEGRFHVLDYKGNWLGARLDDYRDAALDRAMAGHGYRFQALLYTVALDRHLRSRLPDYRRDRQLGECLYLFLRATGLAPSVGIWSQRFSPELIAAVDRVLAGVMVTETPT